MQAFLRQRGSSCHLALSWLGRSRFSTAGDLSSLLVRVAAGDLSPSSATAKLAPLLVSGGAQAQDVGGFAKIDHDRSRRAGFPEVVFGEGKSAEQITDILKAMITEGRERSEAVAPVTGAAAAGVAGAPGSAEATGVREVDMSTRSRTASPIVATRVSPEKWAAISAGLSGLRYHADARIVSFGAPRSLAEGAAAAVSTGPTAAAATPGVTPAPRSETAGKVKPSSSSPSATNANSNVNSSIDVHSIGKVAVLSAGTSDLAVAEEAAVLAELAGAEVRYIQCRAPTKKQEVRSRQDFLF